jgi:hypothetical protein
MESVETEGGRTGQEKERQQEIHEGIAERRRNTRD